MKKIDFYSNIEGEAGVIMAFTKIHEQLGFTKLMSSSSRGFDIDSIEYNGKDVTVEFEYKSSNFIGHGHPEKMDAGRDYIVICWEDDCNLMSKMFENFNKSLYAVIEMRKYVNVKKSDLVTRNNEEPKFVVLSYNPDNADRLDFGVWAFFSCFRIPTSISNPKLA